MEGIKRIRRNKRFSECVIFNQMAFISGQVDYKKSFGIREQTSEVLKLIDELLEESGTDKENIIHANIYLQDIGDISGMNEAWEEWVSVENPPARTVAQSDFANLGCLVKISVVAAVPPCN